MRTLCPACTVGDYWNKWELIILHFNKFKLNRLTMHANFLLLPIELHNITINYSIVRIKLTK